MLTNICSENSKHALISGSLIIQGSNEHQVYYMECPPNRLLSPDLLAFVIYVYEILIISSGVIINQSRSLIFILACRAPQPVFWCAYDVREVFFQKTHFTTPAVLLCDRSRFNLCDYLKSKCYKTCSCNKSPIWLT